MIIRTFLCDGRVLRYILVTPTSGWTRMNRMSMSMINVLEYIMYSSRLFTVRPSLSLEQLTESVIEIYIKDCFLQNESFRRL